MMNIAKRLFFSKNKEEWTTLRLVKLICHELESLPVEQRGSTLLFKNSFILKLKFEKNRYTDPNIVELNTTVQFEFGDNTVDWFDIFHLCKIYRGDKYRGFRISAYEKWETSRFRNDINSFLKPMLLILLDEQKCKILMKNHAMSNGTFVFDARLSENEPLLTKQSNMILQYLK